MIIRNNGQHDKINIEVILYYLIIGLFYSYTLFGNWRVYILELHEYIEINKKYLALLNIYRQDTFFKVSVYNELCNFNCISLVSNFFRL